MTPRDPPVQPAPPEASTLAHQPAVSAPLTRAQFSFLRGIFQGLDERQLWARYLPGSEAGEPAQIRKEATIWIGQLAALARRRGRPDGAALLRWPSRRAPRAAGTATIDEFAARFPADMHSEAEIVALWKDAQQPADDRAAARRRARRVERQLETLRWLEGLESTLPLSTDRLAGWLPPGQAARLAAVGLESFEALRRFIARLGPRWHRAVPRLGAVGAGRIEAWWNHHAASLGTLPISARRQAPPPPLVASPIVPLERLRLPAPLSGAAGSNRGDFNRCRLAAADDLEAVQAWLTEHASSPHTARTYRREAERLLLWSVFLRDRALSSLDASDCATYLAFLRNPPADWLAPRHVSRCSASWRPLEAALSEPSVRAAAAIARALFAWLVRQRYLAHSPWGELVIDRPATSPLSEARGVSPPAAKMGLEGLARESEPQRRALLELACAAGLRSDELAAARLSWLREYSVPGETPRVRLCVPARGRWPARRIDLPASAVLALQVHGALAPDGTKDVAARDDRPLFGHRSDARRPLSAARIGSLLAQGAALGEAGLLPE